MSIHTASTLQGVLSPVLTPFGADLEPDAGRLVRQCGWLMDNNVGLALFGTNSEANSLSVAERKMLLEEVVGSGLAPSRMMPGTSTCNLPETIDLTAHAVRSGVAGVLMLPPFYYKGMSDDGLFDYFARVIEGVADQRLRIYLYHIPPVSQVPISCALIGRLLEAYPGIIKGAKDSGGDWSNMEEMQRNFGADGFEVFAGAETFLLQNMRAGGAGCISATANVNPAAIAALHKNWRDDGADEAQASLNKVRTTFAAYPMIPAMKAAVARWSNDPTWSAVRPPLVALDADQQSDLFADLDAIGFSMPGLGEIAND